MTKNPIRDELERKLTGASPEEVVDELFAFMRRRGNSHYDEAVTQLEHALQCADLARERSLGDAAVTAALFHDIGHLLIDEDEARVKFLAEDLNHEVAGSDLLQQWFPPAVTEPIRLHVAAKRYLCSTESAYYGQLSDASKRSFAVQGGKLAADEQAEFKSNPHLDIAVALRRIDDEGKVQDKPVPPLDDYAEIVSRCLRVN